MTKSFLFCAVLLAAVPCIDTAAAQSPTPTPEPPFVQPPSDSRVRREQALAKLFEGQRYMWKLQRMQSQAGRSGQRKLAKDAFEASVTLDPTLAEGHTALSQLAVAVPPRDIEEGIRQAELAVKADRQNLGGHRMLARLFTAKSRLNSGTLDSLFADKARAEWREVARLDVRNAEAWAFLAAFAEARNNLNEQIDALREWVAAFSPTDVGFYEGTMGGSSLSPETANLKLASALTKAGKPGEAAAILSDVFADDSENAEAITLLSDIAGSIDPASSAAVISALQQAIYANPKNVSLIDTLARLQGRVGHFDEAVALLKAGIATLAKGEARAASTLAVSLSDLYLKKDRYAETAVALENALTLRSISVAGPIKEEDRDFVQYVFEKLIHVAKLANKPEAVKAYIERARKLLGKEDVFADTQLAMFLWKHGSIREALSLVRGLRVGRPSDISLLRMEATLLVDTGQADPAVELIRKSRRLRPTAETTGGETVVVPPADEFSDLLFISNLYTRAKRGRDAIETANQALSLASGTERRQIAKTTLATALQTNGDPAAAERILREVLHEVPGNPMALNNLGFFLTERGERLDEAVRLITQALTVDPENPSYLDSLGWAYLWLGRLEDAEKYLTDAVRFDPDSSTIREHLGDLYRQKKDPEKAKAMWEAALRMSADAEDTDRLKKKLGR